MRRSACRFRSGGGPGRIVRRVALLAAFSLAAPAPAAARQGAWDTALDRFADRMAQDVEAIGVGGVTAAVVVGDSVVWARGFGWADAEARIPADARTIYRIGSIAKSVTAVLLMRLVEDGVVALDDPVARYLPEVEGFADGRPGFPPVTFRQLASHTAGLIREPELEDAAVGPIEAWEHQVLASIPATRFQSRPGTGYAYSNIGFGVLGLALSRAAGRPFTELVYRHIVLPLGMESTTFVVTPALAPRLARGYGGSGDAAPDTLTPAREHRGRGYKVPNGGIYSTVHDLARFMVALGDAGEPAILSAASRAELLRVQTPDGERTRYGLGFSIQDAGVGRFVGHGGSVAGYHAHLLVHPESRIGVILLRNHTRGTGLGAYAGELLEALVGARSAPPIHAADWERVLAAEDARAATPAQLAVLREALGHEEPALRRMAVRALGRLERADVAGDIAPLLRDAEPGVRAHAANALAQAARGGSVDRAPLEAALRAEGDAGAAGVMAESLGRMRHGDAEDARRTSALLVPRLSGTSDAAERLGIVRGLYFLARQEGTRPAFDAAALAALRSVATPTSPPGGARAAGGRDTTAVRLRTVALATLAAADGMDETLGVAALRDPAWTVRREAVVAGAALPDTAAVRRLLAGAVDDVAGEVRYEALRAYGRRLAASHGCAPVRRALTDADAHPRLLALELLGACPDAAAADVALLDSLAATAHHAQWHAAARALVSLATLDPVRARARLERDGVPRDPFARAYAARVFGMLGDTAALRRLAADDDVNVRTAAVRALAPLAQRAGDDVYLAQLAVDDSQLLQAASAALEGSPAPAAPGALLDALDRISARRAETSRDARRALLRRAGELGGAAHTARVRPYLRDFDPAIAELAADVVANWTGTRPTPAPTPPPPLPLPTFAEAARLAESRVEIEMMDGGRVVLRPLPFEAPTNAARLARLAARGHYDGLTFHRVVPNFVVQGGSPHANEYTGDGPFSRDELGLASNWRGAVGLSTRGRDTGDAQLYFNLIDNVRLDHDYTVFAVVVEGMEVVDRMQEGARIRSIRVRSP
jgi:CubicO group peptidase (beta-lactamase class C family)/cyclophilin family peptidyl-prolyl cis-trans isomerase